MRINKYIILAIVIMIIWCGCQSEKIEMDKTKIAIVNKIIELKVGESYWRDDRMLFEYCGMVSDNIFSISSCEYRSSVNLYFPVTTKEILVLRKPIGIREVNYQCIKVWVIEETED